LGCTLLLFRSLLYLQLKHSLLHQLDTALELVASQTLNNLTVKQGRAAFKRDPPSQAFASRLAREGFALRLISPGGEIWDTIGNYPATSQFLAQKAAHANFTTPQGAWRAYNYSIADYPGGGWLQVAQSLQPVSAASEHLLWQMLLSFPAVLLVAAGGGWFLAGRALSPIERIISTAENIRPQDFTQRISYQGKLDEVGRLATTIDRMLDRIQGAFARERRFTADAAHELRTPLTAIKGRIGVTLNRYRTLAEYEATLRDLEGEVDRLIRLSNGLLFLARLEGEKERHWKFYSVDLSELLEILLEQFQLQAEEKQIALAHQISPNLKILGNGDYLTSLFLNLLDNSIKYTPQGGRVTVTASLEREVVRVSISNTGEGIAPQHLSHLFVPFYQAEESRSHHPQGVGLGLAIAQEIAHLHGGSISVASDLRQETTFIVSLPACS
jgi:signal transduction histidine kinase